ncbi:MAG: hypothetical protein U5P10_13580 [Spirochaetia bacterium]|nr:hypothetical protein [Spirochaetia bacterium]
MQFSGDHAGFFSLQNTPSKKIGPGDSITVTLLCTPSFEVNPFSALVTIEKTITKVESYEIELTGFAAYPEGYLLRPRLLKETVRRKTTRLRGAGPAAEIRGQEHTDINWTTPTWRRVRRRHPTPPLSPRWLSDGDHTLRAGKGRQG